MSRQRAALAVVLLAAAQPASHAAQVEQEWLRQAKRAIKHVLVVLKNNPQKPVSDIFSRPDVLQALSQPFQEAAEFTLRHLVAVWEEQGAPSSGYLDQLIADVMRNSILASSRMQRVIYADRDSADLSMNKIGADLARRAGLGVRVAEVRSRAERDLLAIAAKGQYKRWVSRLDAATCSECSALHGMVLHVLEEFPADAGGREVRVYRDLLGPPRHPRCRCRLVPA